MSKPVDSPALGPSSLQSRRYKDGPLNGASQPRSPKVSILGYPSRTTQVQDASKVVIQSSYRPSPLSHEFSLSSDEIMNASKSDKVYNSNKGTGQNTPSGAQFHFSIYKWASKGIPLAMPLRRANSSRSKARVKIESSNEGEQIDSQNWIAESERPSAVDIDSFCLKSKVHHTASPRVKSSTLGNMTVKQSSLEVEAETGHASEEAGIDVSRPKTLSIIKDSAEGNGDAVPRNRREETKLKALPQTGLPQNTEIERELSKPASKPLRSLLSDKDDQGSPHSKSKALYFHAISNLASLFLVADISEVKVDRKKEAEPKSLRSTEQSLGQNDADKGVMKQDDLRGLNRKGLKKVASQESPTHQRDGIGRSRAKGKVKEFIKIFNQESPSKPKVDIRPQGGSFGWNDIEGIAENLADHTNIGVQRQVKASHVGTTDAIPETSSSKVNQFHKQTIREHSGRSTASFLFSDGLSEKKNNSASSSG